MKKLMILILMLFIPVLSHAGQCSETDRYVLFSKLVKICNDAMQKSPSVKTFRTNKTCVGAVELESGVMIAMARLPGSVINNCTMKNYRNMMDAQAIIQRYNQNYFNVREMEKRKK